jgi:hypothetical protein
MSSDTTITITAVDAEGQPVTDAFVGVMEFVGGPPRRDRAAREEIDLAGIFTDYSQWVANLTDNFDYGDYLDRTLRYGVDFESGRITHTVMEPAAFDVQMEAVVYAAVPDNNGTVWFASKYLPNPAVVNDVELTLDRAHVGRWTVGGGVVNVWRTLPGVDDENRRQYLCAELRSFTQMPKGTLSFTIGESVDVGYASIPRLTRMMDPNGKWDRWFYVMSGLEERAFRTGDNPATPSFLQQARNNGYTGYDAWPFPTVTKVMNSGFESTFNYQPAPYEQLPVPDEEVKLALGLAGLLVTGGTAGAVLTVLGYYITGLEMAAELLDDDRSRSDLTDRKDDLPDFDRTSMDAVPGSWKPDRPTWAYAHRVPITVDPDSDATHEGAIRALWKPTPYGVTAAEHGFEYRTTVTPRDAGVSQG